MTGHEDTDAPAREHEEATTPFRWDQWERMIEEDEEPPRRRWSGGRRLLVAATIPWVVLAVALLRPSPASPTAAVAGSRDAPDATSQGPDAATDDPGGAGDTAPGASNGEVYDLAPGITGIRFGGRVAPGVTDAGAVALLVAREWLEDVGVPLETDVPRASTGAYVEHLAVESVDFPAPGSAVVSLLGILLEVEDGAYHAARAVRLGVPVRLDASGVGPAGSPWWLPPPELVTAEPDWESVDDPDLLTAAEDALTDAGYREVTVEEVARARDSWPLRVVATARPPDGPSEGAPTPQTVWLKEGTDQIVVAGWVPAAAEHGAADAEADPLWADEFDGGAR